MRRLARPWAVTLAFLLAYVGVILARNAGDPMSLVLVGSRFADGDPQGTAGYDGQFYYHIALDPASAPARLDVPAYRFQRILYPLLARALALGAPALIPWTLLLINLVAQPVGAALVERLLVEAGASRWYALAYGLWVGLVFSVRLDLAEPLSYALAAGALLADRRGRPYLPALLFGLSVFAKETALVFGGAYGLHLLAARRWSRLAALGLLAAAPYATYQLWLWEAFGSIGLGSGGWLGTPFEILPFMGIWRIGLVSLSALGVFLTFLGPMVIFPSVWGLIASARRLAARDRHLDVWMLAANAAIIPFTPFSTFREPLAIVRFMTGLVLAVLLFGAHVRSRRVLNYSTLWLAALVLLRE